MHVFYIPSTCAYLHNNYYNCIGLDVHDTNLISRNIPLKPGMVITMEPGIYLPTLPTSKYLNMVPPHFRGIGVRIEDDLLITNDNSCDVLSKGCPKTVHEIQELVNS